MPWDSNFYYGSFWVGHTKRKKKTGGLKFPWSLVFWTVDTISHTVFSLKSSSVEITKESISITGLIS